MSGPRLARLLLRILLSREDREYLLGDLEEGFAARGAAGAGARARRWYWTQTRDAIAFRSWRRPAHPHRDRRSPGDPAMYALVHDLRHQARLVRARPLLSLAIVATMALGIGLTTTLFSAVSAVLLRPLPWPDADRLVVAWEHHTRRQAPREELSPANFLDWQARTRAFERFSGFGVGAMTLVGAGDPQSVDAMSVSGEFFDTLGVPARHGRTFTVDDDREGAARVAVISHGLWRRQFGGDPRAVGRGVMLEGETATIVGVMPVSFRAPAVDADLWVPFAFGSDDRQNRGGHFLFAIGRLAPGVTVDQADADLERVAGDLAREYPRTNAGVGVTLVPLREQLVGQVRPTLLVLFGAVVVVLLVACANVANLLLADATRRESELAVRAALGAPPRRLAAQLLTESMALAAAGGLAGLALGAWLSRLSDRVLPATFAALGGTSAGTLSAATMRQELGQLDWRVVVFAVLATSATGLLFGVAPALRVRRMALTGTLNDVGRSTGNRSPGRRLRRALIVGQLAVALVLVVAAGLLVRSVSQLRAVDPGFDPRSVLTMRVALPAVKYQDPARRRTFYDEILTRVERLPGVESAGIVTFLPLTFSGLLGSVAVEGRPSQPAASEGAHYRVVSADYFRTLRIPIAHGRPFRASDTIDAPRVAIINTAFARMHWGADVRRALGARIKPFARAESPAPWLTIVGIAGTAHQHALDTAARSGVFAPYTQGAAFTFAEPRDLAVRARGEALSLSGPIQAIVRAVDPDQPIAQVRLLTDVIDESLASRRVYMYLLGSFALVALGLAAFGVYSVIAHLVASRTREVAVRLALGAAPRQVGWLVVAEGLMLAGAGLALGLLGAAGAVRTLERVLFGVAPFDVPTFAAGAGVLFTTALAASIVPAWRATRIDPATVLR